MTWKAHQTSVVSVRCSPDEDHVASASVDGILYIHNLRNGKTVTKLQQRGDESKDALKMIEYSPFERSRIAACTDTGKVQVWESSRAKLLTSISAHVAPCSAIAFSQVNAALLISAGLDKTVKLHDVRARKTVSTLTLDSPATAVYIAADGTTLAVGTASGQVFIYDLQKAMKPIQTLTVPSGSSSSEVECLTFQRASHVASGSSASSSANLKTPRAPNSAISITQTDNYFAPSPQVVVVPAGPTSELDALTSTPSSLGSRASLGSAATQPMDLFSPLKSFEPHATSTPASNVRVSRADATSAPSSAFDAPFTPLHSSTPRLSLDALSPLQSSTLSSPSEDPNALAPSGTPLALLSPAPPTPSSYRYTSRLSSTLFSPLAPIPGAVTSEESAYAPTSPGRFPVSDAISMADSPLSSSIGSLNLSPLTSGSAPSSSTPRKTASIDFNLTSPLASTLQSPVRGSTSSLNFASPTHSAHASPHFERYSRTSPPSSPSANRAAPSSTEPAADLTHEGIQWQLVQSVLASNMDGFRTEVQAQLHSMHLEMIRQFHIQQAEISALLQEHKTNKELIDIIKELKAENEKLRKLY